MEYKYWLPDGQGNKIEYETNQNAIVIIGANGAGKSKLGAWIEQQSMGDVHRIGAQRNLNFNENIPLKNYTEAENLVFYGNGDAKDLSKGNRWNWGRYTTTFMNDFDNVLAALIALKNNENDQFAQACKNFGIDKNKWPDAPITAIDRLRNIWSNVLPQRTLVEDDSKIYATLYKNGQEVRYSATEMSDGERAVLYLTSQVLSVPQNKILIIDEPEIHLHRSIMHQLWNTLETVRSDCLFIYITHDLHFASTRGKIDKIWIKNYDGENWQFERIKDEDIPEELTLEILGSRKNVLFVEGEKNSWDYQLYTLLYPNYHIIPCGGCNQVIARTRAFRNSALLHDCMVYGLIDRDYRSDCEIERLKDNGIYILGVAEVENLFIVEELIRLMALRFGVQDVDNVVSDVISFVIDTRFANTINKQICQSVVCDIKYQLSCIEISNKSDSDAKASLKIGLDNIDYDLIKEQREIIFQNALNTRNYAEVIKIFNEKGLAAEIGAKLGIDKREYMPKVINLLKADCHDEIICAMAGYLPDEISRL